MRVHSLLQVGSKQGGGGSTLQNSEEMELKKINQKCAIDREEQRLNLIEELATFERKFGHWGTREYVKHGDRIRAASAAIGLIEAVLRDEEMTIKTRLDMIAFELGYRMKAGRFED
jgi:hypothetical protein